MKVALKKRKDSWDRGPSKSNHYCNGRVRDLPENGPYVVMDNGSDIAILGMGWTIIGTHSSERNVIDASGTEQSLVDAITTVLIPTGQRKRHCVIRVNNAMYDPKRKESLLPPDQLRWNNITVNDCAIAHGGKQNIVTKDITIDLYWDGKTYFFEHVPTKKQDATLPRSVLSGQNYYQPTRAAKQHVVNQITPGEDGNHTGVLQAVLKDGTTLAPTKTRRVHLWNPVRHLWKPYQLAEWKHRLACSDTEIVRKTFLATTQLVPKVRHENERYPKDYHVARFPLLSHRRLAEAMYCDTVELVSGKEKFQALLCHCDQSRISAIYPLGKHKSAAKTLQALYEFVRDFGCPRTIYSDYAKQLSQSAQWKRFTANLCTILKSSEAEKQNQNIVERAWQTLQHKAEYIRQRNLVPDHRIFYLYSHLCDLNNYTARRSLNWITPHQAMNGEEPDISFLRYHFWEPVWYLEGKATLPERKWVKGRFLHTAWHTGDSMCYAVCPDSYEKERVVHRSLILPRHPDENTPRELITRPSDYFFPTPKRDPTVDREGRKRKRDNQDQRFEHKSPSSDERDKEPGEASEGTLGEPGPIEAQLREEYLKAAADEEQKIEDLATPPVDILDQGSVASILSHRRIRNDDGSRTIKFRIETQRGTKINNVDYEDLRADAPITLAKYILSTRSLQSNENLVKESRQALTKVDRFIKIARRMEVRTKVKMTLEQDPAMVSISRLSRVKSRRLQNKKPHGKPGKKSNSPNKRKSNAMGTFKYGVYVPRTIEDALSMDSKNNDTSWEDAIKKEIDALQGYGTFKVVSKGKERGVKESHQYAPLRMIFDVKQCGRRKARLVIGGHVVDSGHMDTFASNMKAISAKLLMLIAARNNLNVLTADIKNAYLCAKNKLPVYCRLGKEFNIHDKNVPLGALATVEQALYGLPVSANQWRSTLAATLRSFGFKATRYDGDVWMRQNGNLYDYIGTHTDDLLVVSKDPQSIIAQVESTYKLSGIGEPTFHLGCDYEKGQDGIWRMGTRTHVAEGIKKVEEIVGHQLGKEHTPMVEKLEPEMDKSEILNEKEHRQYQQLIGIAQWLVTCGRVDLAYALNSLSRFSASPRQGHFKAAIRMFKYLKAYPVKWIRLDPTPHVPHGELTEPSEGTEIDWKEYYADAEEELDPKRPATMKTKSLTTAIYFDSNHAHDKVTRRSVTGVIAYIGSCPVMWMSKRQGAIATSTYSAELCAARQGAEEAINLRYMLRSLGVPVEGKTLLIGDNMSSLICATRPGTPCKKKASSIAYHYVRECNAAGIVDIKKIHTDFNLADVFTKALGKSTFQGMIKRIYN